MDVVFLKTLEFNVHPISSSQIPLQYQYRFDAVDQSIFVNIDLLMDFVYHVRYQNHSEIHSTVKSIT
jgi:hypothetical protein